MTTVTASQLGEMAINVLERTAMVLAEPVEQAEQQPTMFARIEFGGANAGSLTLGASEGFVREVAAGFLGVEPGEVDLVAQGVDALKELTNMVGGSVLVALAGTRGDYSLGLPAMGHSACSDPRTACSIGTEMGVLTLALEGSAFANAA